MVRNQASIELKITKCTTIGPPRIGKTCLKHLLTGQEWDTETGTASTNVMEAPEWVECYSVEEGGAEELWKLVSKEQQHGELLRAVNTSTTGITQQTTTPSEASSTIPPSDAPSMTTSSDTTPTTPPSDAMPSNAPFETTPNSAPPPNSEPNAARKPATVRQALEALAGACSREKLQDFLKDKKGGVLGKRRLIHFIDTGGQGIYHDIHPVLITSPSTYLVVFSMKDFYQKNDEGRLAYFRSELIQRPLRSIYTLGTKTPRDKCHLEFHPEAPKIFIVGTHLDQICLGNSDMEIFLDDISKMIEQEIGNKPYRQFVQFDNKGRSFWAVDNTKAGREQDEGVKEYISTLRLLVQDRSMEMSVKVPLPWMLLKMVMDGNRVRYCRYSELLEEACIRGYVREGSPDADLDTMLRLFHILGLIYHKVPAECKKEDSLVFIDPDCLYSATSDFLMAAKEEIEDSQGGSEEGQRQSQAATKEEIEDSQGSSEEGQHQTQAVAKKETEDSQGGSEEGRHQSQAATTEETEDSQGGSEEGQHQNQAATTEETEDSQGGSEEGQHQSQAAITKETEDSQGGSEEGQHQSQAAITKETEDSQGGSEEGQHQSQAATTEETEDSQGGSEVGQHQSQDATMDKDKDKHQTSPLRPLALTEGDSATSQKPRQTAPMRKGLGGVDSVKVVQRISNSISTFLFDMHTVLCSLERVVMNVGQAPPEVVSENLMKIGEGVGEKNASLQDANTLQSKYRILAKEMVFKLANSVRKVLQSSMPEDKKSQLDSVMKDFWFQCRMTRRSIEVDDFNHLLLLLTELRIIAGLNQDCYLIPAALPQCDQIPVAGGIEPLLFTLISQDRQSYYLPSGLFCCLISELVTGLGWTVYPLGRTHVAFIHEDLIGRVHAIEHESYIEIKLESEVTPQHGMFCNILRQQMHERINCMYRMIYDPPEPKSAVVLYRESKSAVVGFKCNCGRDAADTTHFAAYQEDGFECCLKCLLPRPMPTELHPLTDEQLVWFP